MSELPRHKFILDNLQKSLASFRVKVPEWFASLCFLIFFFGAIALLLLGIWNQAKMILFPEEVNGYAPCTMATTTTAITTSIIIASTTATNGGVVVANNNAPINTTNITTNYPILPVIQAPTKIFNSNIRSPQTISTVDEESYIDLGGAGTMRLLLPFYSNPESVSLLLNSMPIHDRNGNLTKFSLGDGLYTFDENNKSHEIFSNGRTFVVTYSHSKELRESSLGMKNWEHTFGIYEK